MSVNRKYPEYIILVDPLTLLPYRATGGGGGGSSVNLLDELGNPITHANPLPATVVGTVTANQGTSPWVVGDGGGSLTVDGTVAVSGTVAVDQVDTASLDYDTDAGTVNQTVVGLALPASGGPVAGGTAANPVRTDPTGTTAQPITDNGGSITVDGPLTDTQLRATPVPVSAASLPLPTGAATESTLGTRLSESDFDTKVGSLTETAPATDVASSGLNGRLQRIAQRITALIALVPAALTGSGNFKVALVESTAAQAITNANLDAALSTLLTTSDFDTKTGSLTETAPATDVASSGLNGRLQRVAQRITSLIALLPSALVGGRLDVNLGAAPATVTAQGVAAHGATISGNPLRAGGRAVNAEVTALTNGQTADLVSDLVGKLIVLPFANPENLLSGATSDIVDTSTTQVIAAQAAGVRIYVTSLLVQNSHATVGTWVNIKDGSTTLHTVYAASAGGGARLNFSSPLKGTAATALNAVCETTGANVRVSASGYKGV